jgi:hypothetical protein
MSINLIFANGLARRSSLAVPVLLFCLLFLSACSSSQGSQYSAAASNNSGSAYAQTSASAGANPMPSQEQLAGIGSATVVTVHGKILSVDRANKLVTLESSNGKKVTLKVQNPYNLEAAKPGDPFVARFYEIVTIRKKQPGEPLPPVALGEGIATAAPGQVPGAVMSRSVQLVATIAAINTANETVDLKDPNGVVETVKVANPNNLKLVKVGDDIVITLTRAVAISLDKEAGV